jgi:hypothetical protein
VQRRMYLAEKIQPSTQEPGHWVVQGLLVPSCVKRMVLVVESGEYDPDQEKSIIEI